MYWLPPTLDLPRRSTLFFNPEVIDTGVVWFVSRRVSWAATQGEDLAQLTNWIDDKTFDVLCHLPRPTWMYGLSLSRERGYKAQSHLSHRDMGSFRILALSKLKPTYASSSSRLEDARPFLIFQRVGDGWKLYPRTLFGGYRSALSNILRADSVRVREEAWSKAFDALPEFAWSEEQKYENVLPYRCGTAPRMRNHDEKWWSTRAHPYWCNLRRAFLAIGALESVSFPESTETLLSTFHWNMSVNGPDRMDHDWKPSSFSCDFEYDGWQLGTSAEKTVLAPTEHQEKAMRRMKWVLQRLALELLPENTRILDCIAPDMGGGLLVVKPWECDVGSLNYHLPWFDREYEQEIPRTRSAHDAVYHLSMLSERWVAVIMRLVQECPLR